MFRLDTLLPLEKHPNTLNHLPKPICSIIPMNPLPDPRRQLALDPRRAIPPIQQQNTRIIPLMPNRPPNTLIHSPHARILVILPRRSFSLLSTARSRRAALFHVLELGFPLGALDVWEGEADDEDGAAEAVGEVDAFGHFAADDGEEEAAAVGGNGVGVFG